MAGSPCAEMFSIDLLPAAAGVLSFLGKADGITLLDKTFAAVAVISTRYPFFVKLQVRGGVLSARH